MCTAERHDKEQAVLLVLEEQVLGMPAGQLALEPGAFRHREHGLVLERLGVDAELGEAGEQVLSGGGQAAGGLGVNGSHAVLPERTPRRNRPRRRATACRGSRMRPARRRACQPGAFAA